MRQKPARIKSCAVEDVRRLRNFLLARFVSAGDEERLMHEDDSLLRGFVATLLPPSPSPLPFQLESRRNSRRDEKRNTEIPRFASTEAQDNSMVMNTVHETV